MAIDWRKIGYGLLIIGLCFLGIPLKIQDNRGDEELFQTFVHKFNKTYKSSTEEYSKRYRIFQESLRKIEKFNENRTTNNSALYGITQFSDLTEEEFLQQYLQPNLHKYLRTTSRNKEQILDNNVRKRSVDNLPKKVDWREKNAVTAVRNQGTCGACWAFSTVETIETMNALRTGKLKTLSVQQIIDCAENGNLGCAGGDTCSALEWMVSSMVHIVTEKQYPLTYKSGNCTMKQPGDGVQVANYTCNDLTGHEDFLLDMLAHHGPVAVAVNAINWQNYLGGVIQFHCGSKKDNINHAVQIVGYDLSGTVPHYIVRNSWGVEFGDKGYLYIAIGKNLCGIVTEVSAVNVL